MLFHKHWYLMPFLLCSYVQASEIDEIKKSMVQNYIDNSVNIESIKKDNQQIIKKNSQYYINVVNKAKEYYSQYLGNVWGPKNVKLSTNKNFTQYSKDLNSREDINFEKGEISIELLTDIDLRVDADFFNKNLEKMRHQTIKEAMQKDPVLELSRSYLKKNNVITQENDLKNNENFLLDMLEQQKVKNEDLKERTIHLKDGQQKKIVSVKIKMVPNHLKKRAIRYKEDILVQSNRFNIKPSYIFGTIQTESYFNPLAISHVPAYGLMQIVPSTAGKDAYYALKGKKRLLPPSYLYDSKKNIELGAQYIQIIKEQYLRGIKNKKSLEYCTAIAYNAGIGNLIKSFTGTYNKRKEAISMINSMTPEEVYKHFRTSKRLTLEAKNYVKKIRTYTPNYYEWDI